MPIKKYFQREPKGFLINIYIYIYIYNKNQRFSSIVADNTGLKIYKKELGMRRKNNFLPKNVWKQKLSSYMAMPMCLDPKWDNKHVQLTFHVVGLLEFHVLGNSKSSSMD